MPETSWDSIAGHRPEERVEGTRLLAEKVPRRIVRRRSLRHLAVRAWLDCVDEVRELDGILNEKDRNVVSNNVKVSFIRITVERLR
jgi:hypothetical protein